MRRRMSTLAASAVLAGGLLFAAAPAQAATASADTATMAARGKVTCNVKKMRAEITALKNKANKYAQMGDKERAKQTRAKANAKQRQLQACIDADNNSSGPFG
ncbi:hypothetical protein ACFU99_28135 [Streptomyces sp. NPDC057654]|uniref:hypothetical protein n=1 Tax=Streptomyces sp. NPDC057654 TaxID=3346196 RepID=UPI00369F1E52